MAEILVTGANGQLGSELKKIAASTSHKFWFTDVDVLDITKLEDLKEFVQPKSIDFVINCAAYTAVDKAESDAEKAYLINRDAVKNLTEIARIKDAILIHVSTDYVFDGTANNPYSEDQTVNPVSMYGKTKAEGEKHALEYDKSIIIRTAWLYSTFGNNIVKTILKLSKERDQIKFVFDQTGTPTYAEDLAAAILKIISFTTINGVKKGIFHYSNEGVCSWFDVAWEIARYTNSPCTVHPIQTHEYPTPATRPAYSVLNKTKIKNTFGIEIPYWKDSLYKCLEILNSQL